MRWNCTSWGGVWMALGLLMASAPGAAQNLEVREIGSLHVGGRIAEVAGLPEQEIVFSPGAPPLRINPNGAFQVEQMYAQYVRLQNPRARYPLILAHGGGLTGVTYETTPDGRPGWQMAFLRAGHDVYVTDAVERGRSGWARCAMRCRARLRVMSRQSCRRTCPTCPPMP